MTKHPANFSWRCIFLPYILSWSLDTRVDNASRGYLLCKALEQLLHVWGEVFMQTAERPQHAPDHLQSQTVKLRKLVEEQRVHRPARRDERFRWKISIWILEFWLKICVKGDSDLDLLTSNCQNLSSSSLSPQQGSISVFRMCMYTRNQVKLSDFYLPLAHRYVMAFL